MVSMHYIFYIFITECTVKIIDRYIFLNISKTCKLGVSLLIIDSYPIYEIYTSNSFSTQTFTVSASMSTTSKSEMYNDQI